MFFWLGHGMDKSCCNLKWFSNRWMIQNKHISLARVWNTCQSQTLPPSQTGTTLTLGGNYSQLLNAKKTGRKGQTSAVASWSWRFFSSSNSFRDSVRFAMAEAMPKGRVTDADCSSGDHWNAHGKAERNSHTIRTSSIRGWSARSRPVFVSISPLLVIWLAPLFFH